MAAGSYNLVIEENTELVRKFIWLDDTGQPVIITGAAARLVVKSPKGTLVVDATVGSGLTLDGPNGKISLNAVVGALPYESGEWRWQLDVTPSGQAGATRLLEGEVTPRYSVV